MQGRKLVAPLSVVGLLIAAAGAVTFAGPLDPPAGPVMSTNRVQLNEQWVSLPFTISESGSYVLTSNLTGASGGAGLVVTADDVVIDLNGFSLVGVPGSLDGIETAVSVDSLTVRNGVVRDWDGDGIEGGGANTILEGVHVYDNAGDGATVGGHADVRNSRFEGNGEFGLFVIQGNATNCVLRENAGTGMRISTGNAQGCTALDNGEHGILVIGGTVSGCTADGNAEAGIYGSVGVTVSDSTASFNGVDGIRCEISCLIRDNTCFNNGGDQSGAGIHVLQSRNRVEDNLVVDNFAGVDVDSGGNIIARNSARGNNANFVISGGNAFGPIVNVAGVGNMGPVGGSGHSQANYEF